MHKTLTILLTLMGLAASGSSFADELACPSSDYIKNVKFNQAFENPYQKGTWYLISNAVTVNGNEWNVWFGAILPNAKTPVDAIKEGQDFFDRSPLANSASSYKDKDITICNYIPSGMKYFVAAMNPPSYGLPTRVAASISN